MKVQHWHLESDNVDIYGNECDVTSVGFSTGRFEHRDPEGFRPNCSLFLIENEKASHQ